MGTQNVVTTTELPAWQQQHTEQLLSNVANPDFDPVTGLPTANAGLVYQDQPQYTSDGTVDGTPIDRTAGFNLDQMQAFDLAKQGIGVYQPYLDEAGTASRDSTQGLEGLPLAQMNTNIKGGTTFNGDLSNYMNPYQQSVTDATMAEMNRQNEMDKNTLNANMGSEFGGSRHGVMEAELAKGFGMNKAQMIAKLNSDNFTQAQGAQAAHAGRQLQGAQIQGGIGAIQNQAFNDQAKTLSGIGGLNQSYGNIDVGTMGLVGDQQQVHRQAEMDTNYQDYLTAKAEPFKMASFYSDILQGVPSNAQVQTQTSPAPSVMSQALGGIGQLATAGNQFGWWGDKD